MKKLLCAFCATMALAAASDDAEPVRCKLQYPATVYVLDENGNKTGTRKLKAGTEILVPQTVAVAQMAEGDSPKKKSPSAAGSLKASGISPAQFIAEKITKPTTFECDVSLGECFFGDYQDWEKDGWCVDMSVYGKTFSSCKMMRGYVKRDSEVGKKIYKFVLDGDSHGALVQFHCKPGTGDATYVEIDAFKPLTYKVGDRLIERR